MKINKKIRNDIILVAVIIVIAAAGLLIATLTRQEGSTVNVKIDGEVTQSYSLYENRTVEIITGNDNEFSNTLVIENGKAYRTYVGGVVGFNLTDDSHRSAHYVVACYSNAKSITGAASSKGLISGTRVVNCKIMGSWAEENGNMALCSGDNAGYISGSQIFATEASVTEADVQAMNEAIAAFNNLNAEVSCPYVWTWTSGNWPVLTSVEND